MSHPIFHTRRNFLRGAACSSLACATSGALFGQLSLMNSLLAATASCPGYPPVSDYKALVWPVPGWRQRFVQSADPERRRPLRRLQHVAQRPGAARHGDRSIDLAAGLSDDARQRR